MINNVMLIGRITKDIELKTTTNGISYANFTIAVNCKFKDENGNREADFINCTTWKQSAEFMAKYLAKGHLIAVEGRIQTRTYERSEDNQKIYITEVVCSSVNSLQSKGTQTEDNVSQEMSPHSFMGTDGNISVDEDDLPL